MSKKLTLPPLRQVCIGQDRNTGRWTVSASFCLGSDEMWETLWHAARFADKAKAERLAARVRAKGVIDLDFWLWWPTQCASFAFMHEKPKAQRFDVG